MKRVGRMAALLALTALLGSVPAARSERVQKGNLRVDVTAGLSPKRLPRAGEAPIAVTVSGGIATVDGSLPPQLRMLRIELNRHGHLDRRGLPECRLGQIQPASTARALRSCRPALVGRGTFSVDVVLGTQEPYPTKGRLLIFNGTYRGHSALLGQIYSAHPFANSFVIPFQIGRSNGGGFGTTLTARLPRSFTEWGYITGIKMSLSRRYSYGGHDRSFVSAGCPAAKGFPGAVFPLARTTFVFAGGVKLSPTMTGECRVR